MQPKGRSCILRRINRLNGEVRPSKDYVTFHEQLAIPLRREVMHAKDVSIWTTSRYHWSNKIRATLITGKCVVRLRLHSGNLQPLKCQLADLMTTEGRGSTSPKTSTVSPTYPA